MIKFTKGLLSTRVARGLSNIYSFVSCELESGQLERVNGGPFTSREIDAMIAALAFIRRLVEGSEYRHSGSTSSTKRSTSTK
jgi:hypothetical protein